ncbi:histidinol-phosphate aminotransferase [Rhizoctonia solani AG-1 IB]|uniref:histidinol-phosphate transaminase n=1 Tax=Thanatephorus cucumeris (strain AG1-IB / isolate 7/3/14) TaxID=1108050 RepID=M5BWM1_THACB|nr:histidinol-phosphate aminotransferase [Rhizoctonia solani AG-1 IB]
MAVQDPAISSHLSLDLHRYPDPAQNEIKSRIAELRNVKGTDHIFLGVGSDEVIDLLMRVCCRPEHDKILITPPTYGMYGVTAQVNDIGIVKVPLLVEKGEFQLDMDGIKKAVASDPAIKLIFVCSPGNPTGTLIPLNDIKVLLEDTVFKGIVIVDEAYIDFASSQDSAVSLVSQYSNLCIMQTLSKSFGLAAIRLGVAVAQPPLIQILTNTKAPYNISTPSANLALAALSPDGIANMTDKIRVLNSNRDRLIGGLAKLAPLGVGSVIGGNHANFVVVPILSRGSAEPDNVRSNAVYKRLAEGLGVVVRFRGSEYGCKGCLRITVGSDEEVTAVLERLEQALKEM